MYFMMMSKRRHLKPIDRFADGDIDYRRTRAFKKRHHMHRMRQKLKRCLQEELREHDN